MNEYKTLSANDTYLNWAGIPVVLGPHKNAEVLIADCGTPVAWIVWSEFEVCGEACIDLDSLFCIFEHRGNNYGRKLFDRLSLTHPNKKILGMLENPVLAQWAKDHNQMLSPSTA